MLLLAADVVAARSASSSSKTSASLSSSSALRSRKRESSARIREISSFGTGTGVPGALLDGADWVACRRRSASSSSIVLRAQETHQPRVEKKSRSCRKRRTHRSAALSFRLSSSTASRKYSLRLYSLTSKFISLRCSTNLTRSASLRVHRDQLLLLRQARKTGTYQTARVLMSVLMRCSYSLIMASLAASIEA